MAVISVSRREVEGSTLEEALSSISSIMEVAVWDESRWDEAVFGSDDEAARLEQALTLLSNRGFPAAGQRDSISAGQRRQMRDAMTLCAHMGAGRDVLVSNDRRAFIANGRREAIERTFQTRVMTVVEFEAHISGREGDRGVAV